MTHILEDVSLEVEGQPPKKFSWVLGMYICLSVYIYIKDMIYIIYSINIYLYIINETLRIEIATFCRISPHHPLPSGAILGVPCPTHGASASLASAVASAASALRHGRYLEYHPKPMTDPWKNGISTYIWVKFMVYVW